MECPTCQSCAHFRRHYIISEECCMPVNCGHCTRPRLKKRKPNEKACPQYQEGEGPPSLPDREKVIHFLTTAMLEHILSLELPYEVAEE